MTNRSVRVRGGMRLRNGVIMQNVIYFFPANLQEQPLFVMLQGVSVKRRLGVGVGAGVGARVGVGVGVSFLVVVVVVFLIDFFEEYHYKNVLILVLSRFDLFYATFDFSNEILVSYAAVQSLGSSARSVA